MEKREERSYFEILNELHVLVQSDNIPYQQKVVIEEQLDILQALLWQWSA